MTATLTTTTTPVAAPDDFGVVTITYEVSMCRSCGRAVDRQVPAGEWYHRFTQLRACERAS